MMEIPEQLRAIATCQRLAVVGVAKNCGKTTALATLLRLRRHLSVAPPGLVSVGVDGEAQDALTGGDKPAIFARRNQWIATAEKALYQSTARVEYVEALGSTTPLGEVYVCRVIEPGEVKLAGVRRHATLRRAVERLADHTGGAVWIDGAYGRLIGARPDIAESVLVATGVVAGADIAEVVDCTEHLISRLELPEIDRRCDREAMRQAIADDRPMVVDADGRPAALPIRSAVAGLEKIDDGLTEDIEAIAIPGLVSDRVAERLLATADGGRVLVPDATCLHLAPKIWGRLRDRWQTYSLHSIDVVGLSYNPTGMQRQQLDPDRLSQRLQAQFEQTFVFDPLPYFASCA